MSLISYISCRPFQISHPLSWLVLSLSLASVQAAEFQFDFQQNGNSVPGGTMFNGGTSAGNDGSRFIQDTVFIGGQVYWHVVVGDPATGFAQESYIQAYNPALSSNSVPRGGSLYSGGNERALLTGLPELIQANLQGAAARLVGNARDPFGLTVSASSAFKPYDLSGVGTTHPTRMTMRMSLTDRDISLDIFKPLLDRKPLISQITKSNEQLENEAPGITELTMISRFEVDLRNVSYSTLNKVVPIINNVTLLGSKLYKPGVGDFDMGMAQHSNVTAGQYIFTPGSGWSAPTDPDGDIGWDVTGSTFDEGSYSYADGGTGFNVYGVRWENFFDSSDAVNIDNCSKGNRTASFSCPSL